MSSDHLIFSRSQSLRTRPFSGACRQRSFVCTNCIDCLDRTNALQTRMGVDALGFQLDLVLERLGYLERYGRFSPIPYAYAYTYVYAFRKRVV